MFVTCTVFIFNTYTAIAKSVLTANWNLRNQRLHSRGLGGTPISTLGKICALLGITQHVVVIPYRLFIFTDVSRQPVCPIFKGQD
jgi:hypothetical protein